LDLELRSRVFIEVEGIKEALDRFLIRMQKRNSAASIYSEFRIFNSLIRLDLRRLKFEKAIRLGQKQPLVLPDIATCPDCLSDISDPANRRVSLSIYQLHQTATSFLLL